MHPTHSAESAEPGQASAPEPDEQPFARLDLEGQGRLEGLRDSLGWPRFSRLEVWGCEQVRNLGPLAELQGLSSLRLVLQGHLIAT
jgi:hypothetical protein